MAENTVIGHKRIVRLNGIYTDCLRLVIDDARVRPALSFLAVYREEAPETPLRGVLHVLLKADMSDAICCSRHGTSGILDSVCNRLHTLFFCLLPPFFRPVFPLIGFAKSLYKYGYIRKLLCSLLTYSAFRLIIYAIDCVVLH